MSVLWTTEELPGLAFDPEPPPDDEDDDTWCYYPDLGGQGADSHRLATMTSIEPIGGYL